MKLIKILSAIVFGCFLCLEDSCASSLDDLYRDIIRSDNMGYLPLFVKNRQIPAFLIEIEGTETLQTAPDESASIIKLSNNYRKKMIEAKLKQEQWLKTIDAVKKNQITPLELNEITKRVDDKDPQATEILAWMYATGVGVSSDFIEAFHLYKRAAQLNVANAEKNAMIVYQSMNKEQRKQIRTSFKPL